jgi:sulfur carrier protein
MERVKGIEPSSVAWEATALPLSYTRDAGRLCRAHPAPATRRKKSQGIANMQIHLNGQPQTLDDGLTVADVLERNGYADRRVAVEINQAIVPRSAHKTHRLSDGDRMEIVQAMGGG